MTQKELIRQEIERLKEEYNEQMPARLILESLIPMGKIEALNKVLAFIDSLPDENNPEPYNPVYDEDYLNEKIAKATKSWKGVDVDAMLAESRGYQSAAPARADNRFMAINPSRRFRHRYRYGPVPDYPTA